MRTSRQGGTKRAIPIHGGGGDGDGGGLQKRNRRQTQCRMVRSYFYNDDRTIRSGRATLAGRCGTECLTPLSCRPPPLLGPLMLTATAVWRMSGAVASRRGTTYRAWAKGVWRTRIVISMAKVREVLSGHRCSDSSSSSNVTARTVGPSHAFPASETNRLSNRRGLSFGKDRRPESQDRLTTKTLKPHLGDDHRPA